MPCLHFDALYAENWAKIRENPFFTKIAISQNHQKSKSKFGKNSRFRANFEYDIAKIEFDF